jgi:nitrite reductase/ring-hydroxylating ferredoxin subunit
MTDPQPAPAFVRVASTGDIPPATGRAFAVGRYEVAIFNVDGSFYALENSCPHQGGPLAEGWMEGALITCPWHGWCFDVRSGKMTLGDFARVPRFELRIDGEDLYVSTEPSE